MVGIRLEEVGAARAQFSPQWVKAIWQPMNHQKLRMHTILIWQRDDSAALSIRRICAPTAAMGTCVREEWGLLMIAGTGI